MEDLFVFKKIKGVLTVIDYLGENQTKIIIPDMYQGEYVTAIVSGLFWVKIDSKNKNLEEIILPEKLETIGQRAFMDCLYLKKITFPNTLKEIKSSAFKNCCLIEEIILPESVEKIGYDCFTNCSSLKKIVALNKNIDAKENCLNKNYSLNEVSFNLIKFSNYNFIIKKIIECYREWDNLTEEEKGYILNLSRKNTIKNKLLLSNEIDVISSILPLIPKLSIEKIDELLEHHDNTVIVAKLLDYKSTKYTPKEIKKHQDRTELLEVGLELPTLKEFKKKWKIVVKEREIIIKGYLGNNENEVIPKTIADQTPITQVFYTVEVDFAPIRYLNIQADLECLDWKLFEYNDCLEEVILPDSLKEISILCFYNCRKLKSVQLPKNLHSINKNAFEMCFCLEEIEIPDTVKVIEDNAFKDCQSLKLLELPKELEVINSSTFLGCSGLSSIKFPEKLSKINQFAFKDCSALEKIEFPKSLIHICVYAFQNCTSVRGIIFQDGIKVIESFAFAECIDLEEIEIPKTVELIGEGAFYGCVKLKKVTFLGEMPKLEPGVFEQTPYNDYKN